MEEKNTQVVIVTLHDEDVEIIDAINALIGAKKNSAAIRFALRDWMRKKDIREDCNENKNSTVGLR